MKQVVPPASAFPLTVFSFFLSHLITASSFFLGWE